MRSFVFTWINMAKRPLLGQDEPQLPTSHWGIQQPHLRLWSLGQQDGWVWGSSGKISCSWPHKTEGHKVQQGKVVDITTGVAERQTAKKRGTVSWQRSHCSLVNLSSAWLRCCFWQNLKRTLGHSVFAGQWGWLFSCSHYCNCCSASYHAKLLC